MGQKMVTQMLLVLSGVADVSVSEGETMDSMMMEMLKQTNSALKQENANLKQQNSNLMASIAAMNSM